MADARFATFLIETSPVYRNAPPRFMLGNGARQVSGSAVWLAQLPSGAIVGINDYRLIGDTAELADLYHHRGYMHGRWARGMARIGSQTKQVGDDAGDYHYAVIDQADLTLRQQTVLGCRGVFTVPTVVAGRGPVGCVRGTLDMIWKDGTLRLIGSLEVLANGSRVNLPIRHYQPDIGTTNHGGSPFGGSTYDLTPVVAENGMLRCVILYRVRLDPGVIYQGVAMFEAHTHFRTQNMYTKDGVNC
ncbi:hypothetical protein [Ralstonia sp. A12]|uniref:hypothetical protein n=1 Tax=Ralstonia sp. A12 TaxID=1217052 RepID=UPI0012ED171D|nr:hypothetical protein [Ralstonia sp. A12]